MHREINKSYIMNSLSLVYFKKFIHLEEQFFNDVNIFVGGNNSGKSTLVKAMLLCLDNLRAVKSSIGMGDANRPKFRFDANEFHDIKIGTFNRAIYNVREITKDNNLILFEFSLGDFRFLFAVRGDLEKDLPTATIEQIHVICERLSTVLQIDTVNDVMSVLSMADGNKVLEDLKRDYAEFVDFKASNTFVGGLEEAKEVMTQEICMRKNIRRNLFKLFAGDDINRGAEFIQKDDKEFDSELPGVIEYFEDIANNPEDADIPAFDMLHKVAIDYNKLSDDNFIIACIKQLSATITCDNVLSHMFKSMDNYTDEERKLMEKYNEDWPEEPENMTEEETKIYRGLQEKGHIFGNDVAMKIRDMVNIANSEVINLMRNGGFDKLDDVDTSYYEHVCGFLPSLGCMIESLRRLFETIRVEYISAHYANQNAVYSIVDKNDYVAQTIHKYYRENIQEGSEEHDFLLKWLCEFEICDDFEINNISGEAYTFIAKEVYHGDKEGEYFFKKSNLADLGMGSIQLVVLLLRLAVVIKHSREVKNLTDEFASDSLLIAYDNQDLLDSNSLKPVIVIEEPEQNLHPKLQSLLADLIDEIRKKYEIRFFIETHSEYLVRKLQVFVKNEGYKNQEELEKKCPYNIIYFPGSASESDTPYRMVFRPDGCFENDFGEGFFDEATNLAFQVF